jgi:hypothetical protein
MEVMNNEQQPQQAPQYTNNGQMVPPPSSNLIWGILTTIFCCLPFGIVSIVYASRVDSLWYAGYHDESRRNAKKAGNWALISAISAVAFWVLYILFFVIIGVTFGEEILDEMYY